MTEIALRPQALPAALTFERTVARAHAHRRALGEVFVSDSVADGDSTFYAAVQIPRAHSLWYDRTTVYHDPFAMAEAARQGSFVVLHRHVGVPVGLPFSMLRYEFEVTDRAAFLDDEKSPLEGVLRYDIVSRTDRGADFADLTLEGELSVGGRSAMRLGADVVFLARADYEALRAYQQSRKSEADPGQPVLSPLPPERVGRMDSRNIVIAEPADEGARWVYPLLPDPRHPALFDHEYDHVPGPFIIEAFRQAAIDTAVRSGGLTSPITTVVSCSSRFDQFGEFGAPLECVCTPVDPTRPDTARVDVELRQFDRVLTTGTLELASIAEFASSFVHRVRAES
ncbi:AfsA-related hotdog domain-containing protein [Nocardia sp. NPDC060259]|uniref:AfsA-related hotdog domain-containing protein n=1 Tax=Nocardia sp. NPDC060259 TaxID=3347088 RepID=UPI0036542F4A